MGSFIARLAAERYITPTRLIIMGTGGPNPAAGLGLGIIGITKRLRGDWHISKLVYALAFGGYNNRFKGEKDIYAWLTTDMSIRDRYRVDPLCTFPFTVSAMGDLIRLTKEANRPAWFTSLPKDLPVLLVSGADDPVGGNGRGVLAVRDRLQKAGISVTCRIYEGARHEILNDACRADVTRDIQEFVG
jgi:alpha-beta hydrolase superfamily lysophospholipase